MPVTVNTPVLSSLLKPLLTLAVLLMLIPAWLLANENGDGDAAAVNSDGLLRMEAQHFDTVYRAADADFTDFTAVFIAPIDVSFQKHWQREQNRNRAYRVRDQDMERIRSDMAELLEEVLADRFVEMGYTLAEGPGPGVLLAEPNITRLNIIAPDIATPSRRMVYSESAGEMTLGLSLKNSSDGTPLLALTDRQWDRRDDFFEWRTRPGNRAVAKRLMRRWAEALDTLLSSPGQRMATRQVLRAD